MLQPVKDLDEYKRIKQALRNKFDAERTGDQQLFVEQAKLFKPLIEPLLATQEKTVQARPVPAIMGEREPVIRMPSRALVDPTLMAVGAPEQPLIKIDLDSGLDDEDIQNLRDMNFDLPSEVFKNKQIVETLNQIKTENRSLGQKLGKGSDVSEQDKVVYRSWKGTLLTYKQKILGLEGAKQFVGEGVDVIFYPSVEDLCTKLAELDAAKLAGNTGLDNRINAVLDELLRTQALSKDVYDDLHKIIFL